MFNQYHHPETLPNDNQTFQLVSLTHSSSDEGWHNLLHYHHFNEIIYCLSGSGYLHTLEGQQDLIANRFILVNQQVEHTEFVHPGKHLEYLVIAYTGPNIVMPKSSKHQLYSHHDYSGAFHPIVRRLLHEIKEPNELSPNFIHHYVQLFLLELMAQTSLQLVEQTPSNLSIATVTAKKYIEENFAQEVTLTDLAELTFLSTFHLSRLFKQEIGLSVTEYLNKTRIDRATILLATTNLSVNEIATSTGFNSAAYFSNKFKKLNGISPRQYRDSLKED